MIIGSLHDLAPIASLGSNFQKAVLFLQTLNVDCLTPQKYEIDGSNVYAFFSDADLKSPAATLFEAHIHYADIQLITDGCEGIWYSPVIDLTVSIPYNEENDIAFFEEPAEPTELTLLPGNFAVFLPKDAHKPNCETAQSKKSKKLVIKVRVN